MRKAFVFLFLIIVFTQCESDSTKDCSTPATVRDLTGLDGCGWVFELEDGTRLEPLAGIPRCGFGELSKEGSEDPLASFEFVDGKKVFISYEKTNRPSICMVGPTVKITCISEAASISEE